jgi:hypothetical protein
MRYPSQDFQFQTYFLPVIQVPIEVLRHSIHPKSHRLIPVAILSTSTFDATQVDPSSVKFGPAGAVVSHGHGHTEDVNRDGRLDLVLDFRTPDTGILCGATSASLTGKTRAGQAFQGTASFKTRGCAKPK